MAYHVSILADSISPQGCRVTTYEGTYPRIVHSEMMTHGMFRRNSASTRAIAIIAQLENLLDEFFMPTRFGINQSGMQAAEFLTGPKADEAKAIWEAGRDRALTTFLELILGRALMIELLGYDPLREFVNADQIRQHKEVIKSYIPVYANNFELVDERELNAHKQLAGRGLEGYMWHTIVLTATEFENFFALRDHPAAQPEIQYIAHMMREAYDLSTPKELKFGEWHLPLVDEGEFGDDLQTAIEASVGRAAAMSYNRQNDKKSATEERERYDRLLSMHHMSPFEHQATPFSDEQWQAVRGAQSTYRELGDKLDLPQLWVDQQVHEAEFLGPFRGWTSHRKLIKYEDDFSKLEAV